MHSIEWAAGLFEGEGSIYKLKTHNTCELKVEMTDKDVVEKFKEVVMCGTVKEYAARKADYKSTYVWRIAKRRDVINLLSKMLPYLGNRRAYKALNILDDLELA